MRVLHTSDLHLGRALFGVRRDETFAKLLDWLIETIRQHQVEVLVVAGDIFDSATPSHLVQDQYYKFLAGVHRTGCCRHTVIVGGNHDSASLLDAPDQLLSALDICVVGQACADPADEVVVLRDARGRPEALVLAVPYLRERDVRTGAELENAADKERRIVEGTRAHYAAVMDAARRQLAVLGAPQLPVIATGHLFAARCTAGDDERSLYVGSLGQIPADVFDERIDYVALGHLHRPQILDGNPARRYAGSPLALDFSENQSRKSVVLVDFDGRTPAVNTLEVPAFDRLERVNGSVDEILARLTELTASGEPLFCEVTHTRGDFDPLLAQKCRDSVGGSPVDVVRIVSRVQTAATLDSQDRIADVAGLTPEEMFALRLKKEPDLDDAAKGRLTLAHHEILEAIRHPENGEDNGKSAASGA